MALSSQTTGIAKVAIGSTEIKKISVGATDVWTAGVTHTDNFNRANNITTMGAAWTNRWNVMGIYENSAYSVTQHGSIGSGATYATPLNTDNQEVQLELGVISVGDNSIYAILGANSTGQCVMAEFLSGYTTYTKIYSVTGWTTRTLRATASTAPSFTVGDVVSLRRVGNVYTGLKNGTPIPGMTWTDSGNAVPRGATHRIVGVGAFNGGTARLINSWTAKDV